MKFQEQNIKGVFEITLDPIVDERGFFVRTYDKTVFAEHGLPTDWTQENHAFSKAKGTLRGLHFLYPPHTEAKLIQMAAGGGFWVFLDVRKGSPTLGKWGAIVLTAEKASLLFIPRGIANGVCALTDNCRVLYHMDNFYDDNAKGAIRWNDHDLGISWPVATRSHIAERDINAQSFKEFLEKTGGRLEA